MGKEVIVGARWEMRACAKPQLPGDDRKGLG